MVSVSVVLVSASCLLWNPEKDIDFFKSQFPHLSNADNFFYRQHMSFVTKHRWNFYQNLLKITFDAYTLNKGSFGGWVERVMETIELFQLEASGKPEETSRWISISGAHWRRMVKGKWGEKKGKSLTCTEY